MRTFAIIGLSLLTAVSSVLPAKAFPSIDAPKLEVSDAKLIQYRGNWGRGGGYGHYGGGYYGHNNYAYRRYGGGHYGGGHYGGYHGGGHYYHGDNDNFGLALGGLAAGALIGSLLVQQPRYYGSYGGGSHTGWCYSRYRSYRAYDNTYQPYYGPRRQCVGPY
ncbi:BA14K family protein [Rhizobium sp. RAF56]|jgi:hypothetical protein|uniref:BA14K family protein n=1 Tax=Rhizobium sp. RAF56 TaxID=3233062 RepID=UPI003F9C782F